MKRKTLIVVILLLLSVNSVWATTGVYIGKGTVVELNGQQDFTIKCYAYYDSNTSSELELSSLVQYVNNYGDLPVDEVMFKALSGDYTPSTQIGYYYITPITTGNYRRLEGSFHETYEKNGGSDCAMTSMTSGYQNGYFGVWDSFWYSNSRDDDFN